MHTLLGERPAARAVRCSALVEPHTGDVSVGVAALKADSLSPVVFAMFFVADDKPAGGARFVF